MLWELLFPLKFEVTPYSKFPARLFATVFNYGQAAIMLAATAAVIRYGWDRG